ncbi:MAG: sugar phosphate isomerase/epimerase family protein [Rhodospirillales bacterium]|jgi:sugar phosphate isomerase/epimerase|nr:sugar phosphate isomerase/epimerase family protein [Rhodospirillales bacterium]
MKIALCNEVIRELDFSAQCDMAAKLGYMGLEVAPFTLGDHPHLLPANRRADLRRAATEAGIVITGLHWLLVTPQGLSINTADPAIRRKTVDVIERLVGLCADLGGAVLVHGSPKQRSIAEDDDAAAARGRAAETLAAAARAAEKAGVVYCIEPLARHETNFVNTVAEAARLVDEIGSPAFRTMIDTSAAGLTESVPVVDLIRKWLPTGKVAHIQLNDTNRRAPGQGADAFAPILSALKRMKYGGVAAVEPFIYEPDGPTTAALAIGYVRGILEGLK